MVSEVVAVALLGLLAVGWALLLRDQAPGSWPRTLTTEQLPNVALFVPLGIGIAAVARRRTRWWIALAVVTSVGIESHQGVFTSRTCSTVDVATNGLGGLVGWATQAVATHRLGGR